MATTKKPTGLTITRSGEKFSLKWKIADKDYGEGQQLQYRKKTGATTGTWGDWKSVSIGTATTAKSITFDFSVYETTSGANKSKKLVAIEFRLRGKRKNYSEKYTVKENGKSVTKTKTISPTWSDWTEKTYTFHIPNKPSVTATKSDEYSDVTTFSWKENYSTSSTYQFKRIEWQTRLSAKESTVTDGTKLTWKSGYSGWNSGTGSAEGSQAITEDNTLLANGSYTRWFRARAVGVKGKTGWVYRKHVYAMPYRAALKNDWKITQSNDGVYRITVNWEVSRPVSHPIDATYVKYAIATPDEDLKYLSDDGWTVIDTQKDTAGTDSSSFYLSDVIGTDQALFIRIDTKHDDNERPGVSTPIKYGYLADPDDVSVTFIPETNRATIEATNNSTVPGAFLAVTCLIGDDTDNEYLIGVIENGADSVTVQLPEITGQVAFGVYAVAGSYEQQTRSDGTSGVVVNEIMRSENTIYEGGEVPLPPSNVQTSTTNREGTVRVTWDWTWTEANAAEISWADHEDAWESTDEPQTYRISNLYAGAWNISGLETGKAWYIRVRLVRASGESETPGAWSDIQVVDLASAPSTPLLTLSEAVISESGNVTASWVYTSTDGTPQVFAELREATITSEGITISEDQLTATETAQHITIYADDVGWETGTIHNIVLRVVSASGKVSDWSDPVAVQIAEPLTATITASSLETVEVVIDDDEEETEEMLALTSTPLTLTVTGADVGGTTRVIIERAQGYYMDRPDGTTFEGHDGETIVLYEQTGEGEITIERDDLIGTFDDGALYRIIATVEDGIGQSGQTELEFIVQWAHQALIPTADVTIDDNIALITPVAPEGTLEGDNCDIYRLSADMPELIFKGAAFGTTYVDPYPAIGTYGGHRIVFKSADDDYITADNQPAWTDTGAEEGDFVDSVSSVIDFNGEQLLFKYNINLDNSWEKSFQETKYLGGNVTGDWNIPVQRSGTVQTVAIVAEDRDMIQAFRRLAVWPGVCHLRTADGTSIACNIDVSENKEFDTYGVAVSFSLSIRRVDTEGYDAVTLAEWEA